MSRRFFFPLRATLMVIALVSVSWFSFSSPPPAQASAGSKHVAPAAVQDAVNYATSHWNWPLYNQATPAIDNDKPQPSFECAEFVARSLVAAGPIGTLTTGSAPKLYGALYVDGVSQPYDLLYVPSLYQFLLNTPSSSTPVGTDIGSNPQNASIGDVVIYGNFEHTAIITGGDSAGFKISEHNNALTNYAIDQIYRSPGVLMPITHIVHINYALLASGALSSVTIPTIQSVQMVTPAPYNGGIVTSGLTLAWNPVNGAQGYDVSVYDVRGQFAAGVSTLATSFTIDLGRFSYGVYEYFIQPLSNVASFQTFYDVFNYEPPACVSTPSGPDCGGGSGIGSSDAPPPSGNAILTLPTGNNPDGCTSTVLPANDDGSTDLVPLPFTADFFGTSYNALYVNNNGNVTFDEPLSTYTPEPIISTSHVIIAPFWADVDTRGTGSQPVTYSYGGTTYDGHQAFCVDWVNVGYYAAHDDKLNSFQLVLIDRSDIAPGDFDIMMNYNQVQWEAGDFSGGSGGLGGSSARIGYSNGVDVSFELPGSGVNGAFLDTNPDGLIYNNRLSPLQEGRYIYPVRNGAAPMGGSITGTVYARSNAPYNTLAGAFVQVCDSGGFCQTTTTDTTGQYVVAGLADGQYTVTVFPPGDSALLQASIGPLTISGGAALSGEDIVLTGPTPPPSGTTITNIGTGFGGLPVIYWGDQLTLTTTGCTGGSASYQFQQDGTVVRSGGMVEGPAGTYTASIAALMPIHGNAHVVISITCPSGPNETTPFDIYIDPSGTVQTVGGQPIADATVTLLRSDSPDGPFVPVPSGSGIMSLANRQNPVLTDSDGHFGWDVVAGYYVVQASAPGCVSPTDSSQSYVQSAVLTVPPAVTNLVLQLSCPGGHFQVGPSAVALTTTPGTSPSQQTLTLQNTGTGTLNWTSNTLPSWVSVSPTSGALAAGDSQTLTLTFNTPSSTPQTYTTNLVLTDPTADNSPVSIPITVVSANVSKTWYFAEGYTGSAPSQGAFSEYLTLENPNPTATTATVTYLLDQGQAPVVKSYTLAAHSRTTLLVNNEIGNGRNVSLVVSASQPIVAERPMYFTYGALPGYGIPGGTDVLGATSLSQQFDFGYIDTTPGHDPYLTFLNPNGTAMHVTIQYFGASGGSPTVTQHTYPANSRGTINVRTDEGLAAGTYSALVTLDQPGLVERPMYLKDGVTGYTGSVDVVGVAQPQADWYFAEGYTNTNFSERYYLSNPNTSQSASATVTFFLSDGSTQTKTVSIPAGGQVMVDANAVLGQNVNNSAHVSASLPILAERFMSFDYTAAIGGNNNPSIPGATDVLGTGAPSNLFYFAEGYDGTGFAEYLTIENPSATQTATVTVTFYPDTGGAPTVKTYMIAPSSRFTLFTADVLPNSAFSMEVVSNVTIVAERPMYFNYLNSGQTGGSDVVGYQP